MEQQDLQVEDEIDEPHIYNHYLWLDDFEKFTDANPVRIGQFDFWTKSPQQIGNLSAAQIVNEYGWIWLWRNGMPSYLGYKFYSYYLGDFRNAHANRELMAYDLQWETELFRVHREVAGVMAFSYLTNNYGATGDWFMDPVKDLKASPTLQWFKHCFAPAAVFIDLADQRYTKHLAPLTPGGNIVFNLVGVNDLDSVVKGNVNLLLMDEKGNKISGQQISISIEPYQATNFPVIYTLPQQPGGYLLICEFKQKLTDDAIISRRYIKVGYKEKYNFYELIPGEL